MSHSPLKHLFDTTCLVGAQRGEAAESAIRTVHQQGDATEKASSDHFEPFETHIYRLAPAVKGQDKKMGQAERANDPHAVPHRKNAAEWVMFTCLRPIAMGMRLADRITRRR